MKSSDMGMAMAFLLWALILFLFAAWPGEPGVLVWIMRVAALISLLVGVLGGCIELAKGRNQHGEEN